MPHAAALPIIDEIQRAFEALECSEALAPAPAPALAPAPAPVRRELVCDLGSALALGSEPYYRLESGEGEREGEAADRCYEYQWTVRRRADGHPVWQTVTLTPELRITAAARGRYAVELVVLGDGLPTAPRLSIDHDVEAEPAMLTAGLARASAAVAQAMRELVADLRPFIIEAATATGSHGVTPRLLAAVLLVEILRRPKAARERELGEAGALERGDRQLGVGQIQPMTAAMVTGDLPWIERGAGESPEAPDPIRAGHDALSQAAKQAIFTQLRWPRWNIAIAAMLLATLKNRPHRYPALTRAELAADPIAVGIVATEYASGGTELPASEVQSSEYGSRVWQQMQEPLLRQFFPDD